MPVQSSSTYVNFIFFSFILDRIYRRILFEGLFSLTRMDEEPTKVEEEFAPSKNISGQTTGPFAMLKRKKRKGGKRKKRKGLRSELKKRKRVNCLIFFFFFFF